MDIFRDDRVLDKLGSVIYFLGIFLANSDLLLQVDDAAMRDATLADTVNVIHLVAGLRAGIHIHVSVSAQPVVPAEPTSHQ